MANPARARTGTSGRQLIGGMDYSNLKGETPGKKTEVTVWGLVLKEDPKPKPLIQFINSNKPEYLLAYHIRDCGFDTNQMFTLSKAGGTYELKTNGHKFRMRGKTFYQKRGK